MPVAAGCAEGTFGDKEEKAAGGTVVQYLGTEGEGWWRSPNPGTVGGTGLLVGEKVPPRYSCVSQSGATVKHHLPVYPGAACPPACSN